MDDVITMIVGCIKILENVDEENTDARLFVVIQTLEQCVDKLDELNK